MGWFALFADGVNAVPVMEPWAFWASLGSNGLLGAIIGWLLIREIPQVRKQMRDQEKDCNAHNRDIVKTHGDQLEAQQKNFQDTLAKIADAHEKHVTALADALRQEIRSVKEGNAPRSQQRDRA